MHTHSLFQIFVIYRHRFQKPLHAGNVTERQLFKNFLFLCSHMQVFQTLHATGQSSMVRDWVLLSLSNFTQRTPVAMAMWSLSCFFVSASTSQWISALYPYIPRKRSHKQETGPEWLGGGRSSSS